jgi:rsbT antagonist protein RsbS
MKNFGSETTASITQIDNIMIVSFTDQMANKMIYEVMNTILEKASKNIWGVVLNYSMVNIIDSYAFNAFKNITETLNVMGVPSIWAGLNPGVICSLLDLGVEFEHSHINTAIDINDGISILKRKRKEEKLRVDYGCKYK